MNNVKTNKTFEQWREQDGMDVEEHNFYRKQGWNAALESVEKEPALTEEGALKRIKDWAALVAKPYDGHWEDLAYWLTGYRTDALIAAGRIPAPATVETPQEGELNSEWLYAIQPLERTNEEILLRHQQALSAREQAVRGSAEHHYRSMLETSESIIKSLRAELAAEKLANEGKYAIPPEIQWPQWATAIQINFVNIPKSDYKDGDYWDRTTGCGGTKVLDWRDQWLEVGFIPRQVTPTLTPAEKAEAWVKWWCISQDGEQLDDVFGWKELATRQANGETIDQIYAEVEGRKG